MFKMLDFKPLPGMRSHHSQMLFANFYPSGREPYANQWLVSLSDGDRISCEVSTPDNWKPVHPMLVMIHGLGGSHRSAYMIRLSRKFYRLGYRVVRVNLRGCGSGVGLNNRPYNSGNSQDIKEVLEALKLQSPQSPITLMGFSLGGNIAIKMAGELGDKASKLVKRVIAVCPPIDLNQSIKYISRSSNWLYHKSFVKYMLIQGYRWAKDHSIQSIYEYDQKVTAPVWGYKSAEDYYVKCSSCNFISNVKVQCDVVLTTDDPFIDHRDLKNRAIDSGTNVWLANGGGHLGFIGWAGKEQGFYWLDKLLVDWLGSTHS